MLTATLMRSTSGLARQQEAARVTEKALGLGRYGKVPTIRHSSRISPDNESDDEHEEEDLRESWTPRFRR